MGFLGARALRDIILHLRAVPEDRHLPSACGRNIIGTIRTCKSRFLSPLRAYAISVSKHVLGCSMIDDQAMSRHMGDIPLDEDDIKRLPRKVLVPLSGQRFVA